MLQPGKSSGQRHFGFSADPASVELALQGCTRLTFVEPKSETTLWLEVRKTFKPQEKSTLIEGLTRPSISKKRDTTGKPKELSWGNLKNEDKMLALQNQPTRFC
jgi:hypothetical protein